MYKYVHGGDIYSLQQLTGVNEILDFSANVNPLGIPDAVKQAITESIDRCDRYPDPLSRELTAALAQSESIDPNFIFCANGASDIIFRIPIALKPKKALVLAPTFADYEKALQTVGCQTEYYLLKPEHGFTIQPDFLDHIRQDIDILYICNPNNPTGQVCEKALIQQVLDQCRTTSTIVFIDECFMDFLENPEQYSAQPFVETYKNLLILKAFTKIYAMAGIRLGYTMTSNTTIIDQLRLSGQDWGVSHIAQTGGISALQQADYLQRSKELIRREREFLTSELKKLGFQVFGSKANFIFFKVNLQWDLAVKLRSYGILIRSCSNYRNLSSEYYRIAVRNRDENEKLIAAIKELTCMEGCEPDESHDGDY